MREPDVAADDAAAPDRDAPEYGGARVDRDVVLEDRVARLALDQVAGRLVDLEALRAERHALRVGLVRLALDSQAGEVGDRERVVAGLDAGADDIQGDGEIFQVLCAPADLIAVRAAVAGAGLQVESAEIVWNSTQTVEVDAHTLALVEKLVERDRVGPR